MKTYNLDLLFEAPREGDRPGPSSYHIYVKSWTGREGEPMLITLECASSSELEEEIDRLHDELEKIRKKARKKSHGR